MPMIPEKANPSWFGFPITVRENVDSLEVRAMVGRC